ncbi:MAG: hypothetical protein WCI41_00640 [bacterium]
MKKENENGIDQLPTITKDSLSLSNVDDYNEMFSLVRNDFGRSIKLQLYHLPLFFSSDEESTLEKISDSLMSFSKEESIEIFNHFGFMLKARILINENNGVNYFLARKLGSTAILARAFLYVNRRDFPKETPFTTIYMDEDPQLPYTIAEMLSELKGKEGEEFMQELGVKFAYLLAIWELNDNPDEEVIGLLNISLETNDVIPLSLPFLSAVQDKAPVFFENLKVSLQSRDFQEMRAMFYELYKRNTIIMYDRFEDGSVSINSKSTGYLNDLLGKEEDENEIENFD